MGGWDMEGSISTSSSHGKRPCSRIHLLVKDKRVCQKDQRLLVLVHFAEVHSVLEAHNLCWLRDDIYGSSQNEWVELRIVEKPPQTCNWILLQTHHAILSSESAKMRQKSWICLVPLSTSEGKDKKTILCWFPLLRV